MATEIEVKPQATDDPYDLGDTGLYVQPELKEAPPATGDAGVVTAPASSSPVQVETPQGVRYQDPVTRQFVKAPEPSTHPEWLTRDAERLAIDPKDFATTEALYKYVTKASAEQRQSESFQTLARTMEQAEVRKPAQVEPPPDDSLGIEGEDEIHPGILKVLKQFKQENQSLREQLQGVHHVQQQNQFESWAQRLHRTISETADPLVVGEGAIEGFDWNSDQGIARTAIRDIAARMAGRDATAADIIKKVPEAVFRLRYGKPKAKPAADAPPKPAAKTYTPEEWAAAGLAPPTARKGARELKGDAKAVAVLTEKMREAGMLNEEAQDQEILETLY